MRKLLSALAAVLVSATLAFGASNLPLLPSTSQYNEPSQIVSTLNGLINQLNGSTYQASTYVPNNFRNLLDNGNIVVQQRGTGAATCANNGAAVASANYGPDRWACMVNVGSGAGQLTPISSAPTPPPGFQYAAKLVRNSGALTQPQCVMQEIPSADVITLQGQTVTFSWYDQALAGLAVDNGNVINAYIFYGTGSDQGLGSWTASPAITPAWTGINSSITASYTISASAWTKHSLTGALPNTATEAAVALCFTPTATGAGATDGFAFTGAQLETGSAASAYEFKPLAVEQIKAYRFFYRFAESAAITPIATCAVSTTSLANCLAPLPVPMRAVPVASYTTGWALTVAAQTSVVTCTGNATVASVASTAVNTTNVPVTCTSAAGFGGAGTIAWLYSNNGAGVINASADF